MRSWFHHLRPGHHVVLQENIDTDGQGKVLVRISSWYCKHPKCIAVLHITKETRYAR